MLEVFGEAADRQNAPIFIFGEVFGKTSSGAGVQDLTYTDEVLDFVRSTSLLAIGALNAIWSGITSRWRATS